MQYRPEWEESQLGLAKSSNSIVPYDKSLLNIHPLSVKGDTALGQASRNVWLSQTVLRHKTRLLVFIYQCRGLRPEELLL